MLRIENQKHSETLDLNNELINDETISNFLIPFLSKNLHFKIIELKGNNLSPRIFSKLAKVLIEQKNLEVLNLEWNRLGMDEEGVLAVKAVLEECRKIKFIDLKNNKIGSNEVLIIANGLLKNTNVLYMDLGWNNITNEGAKHLISSLNENKTMLYLELNGNNITKDLLTSITTILERNRAKNLITKPDILKLRDTKTKEKDKESDKENKKEEDDKKQKKRTKKNYPNVNEQKTYLMELEKNLEIERIQTLHIKKKLKDELEKLKDQNNLMTKDNTQLENDFNLISSKNERLKNEIKNYKLDIESIQKSNLQNLRFYEERLKHQQSLIKKMENEAKMEKETISNDVAMRYKQMNYDWEERIKLIENRIKDITEINMDMEKQIKKKKDDCDSLNHSTSYPSLLTLQEAQFFQKKLHLSQSTLNSLQMIKLNLERRNNFLFEKIKVNEEKAPQELFYTEEEYVRLKKDLEILEEKCSSAEILKEKMKNEVKLKRNQVEKMNEESEDIKERLQKKEQEFINEKENLLRSQEVERNDWNRNKEEKLRRMNELEKLFQSRCQENVKLKGDYAKLIQILQKDVAQTVFATFANNNFI